MTLILAHQIDGNLAVVTDGAGISRPKCCFFPKHGAIVAFWGWYDLCPIALNTPPSQVAAKEQQRAQENYIADALPNPKDDKGKFVEAFEAALNEAGSVHNGDGKNGSSGILLGFSSSSGIEALVYDVNSGKGSWKLREKVETWPVLFGQAHETVEMLAKNFNKSPADFIGPVKSIEDFAKKAGELVGRTSDYLETKGLKRSVALPAWLVVLSKDGTIKDAKL